MEVAILTEQPATDPAPDPTPDPIPETATAALATAAIQATETAATAAAVATQATETAQVAKISTEIQDSRIFSLALEVESLRNELRALTQPATDPTAERSQSSAAEAVRVEVDAAQETAAPAPAGARPWWKKILLGEHVESRTE